MKQNNNREIIQIGLESNIYPERIKKILGNKAPKYLYMMGNMNLVRSYSIGFCGSRKSSIKGLETAQDCAQQAAEYDVTVISGNAAGIDFTAHFNSLKVGGKTIFVLPEGINYFKIKKALKSVWDWNRILIISQFEPDDSWQVYRAMARNLLIIALSRVMIVIEAGEKGGTFNAGLQTLKVGTPLFVAEYQDMSKDAKGNQLLLEKGAQKLTKSRVTNRANMQRIFDEMKKNDPLFSSFNQELFLLG